MKKKLFFLIPLILSTLVSVAYLLNKASLTLYFEESDAEVLIISKSEKIKAISAKKYFLNKSDYEIKVISPKYHLNKTIIKLDKNTDLKLNLDYSNAHYKKLFSEEAQKLNKIALQIINKKNFYAIDDFSFLKKGEYYIAKATYFPQNPVLYDMFDVFKIIFKKDKNQWKAITKPEIVFSKNIYSEIHPEIIDEANK